MNNEHFPDNYFIHFIFLNALECHKEILEN